MYLCYVSHIFSYMLELNDKALCIFYEKLHVFAKQIRVLKIMIIEKCKFCTFHELCYNLFHRKYLHKTCSSLSAIYFSLNHCFIWEELIQRKFNVWRLKINKVVNFLRIETEILIWFEMKFGFFFTHFKSISSLVSL